jgi:hypothetical protein
VSDRFWPLCENAAGRALGRYGCRDFPARYWVTLKDRKTREVIEAVLVCGVCKGYYLAEFGSTHRLEFAVYTGPTAEQDPEGYLDVVMAGNDYQKFVTRRLGPAPRPLDGLRRWWRSFTGAD